MSHPAFTPSRRASLHFGRYSVLVPQRIGGWIGLSVWLHNELVYARPKTVTHRSINRPISHNAPASDRTHNHWVASPTPWPGTRLPIHPVASIHQCSRCLNTPIISAGGVHPYLNTTRFFLRIAYALFTIKCRALAKYIFVDLTIKTAFTTVYSLINCIALPCKSLIDYSIITDYSLHP